MFGKDQPNVVTDEDVGNFVAELYSKTEDPLKYIGVEDDLVGDSKESTTGKIGKGNMS